MAIGCDEPELAREQSPALLTEANRCRTHCSTWPSGKPFHGVKRTFLTGLTVHYTGAHELNTWQTSKADRAKCCNQCFCDGCLSTQEGNICVRRFPICSTYYGKTFVTIPSPSFAPKPLPEPLTDAVPWCLRSKTHGNDIRSENYNSTYDWCGHSMCIDDDEKIVEHHVFGSSMLEKLTPGVKLTVTCHENAGSYMFCKNWQLHVTFWQKLHKPPVGQLHVRKLHVVNKRSRTMTIHNWIIVDIYTI